MFAAGSQAGPGRVAAMTYSYPRGAPLRLPRPRRPGAEGGQRAAATWEPARHLGPAAAGAIEARGRPTVRGATNRAPRPSDQAAGPRGPRSRVRVWGARAQVARSAAPVRQPRARGGASRVPFKRPHHPPLTSVCLSARARVPRRSAPQRPQPRGCTTSGGRERAAPLGPAAPLRRRLLPAPAPAPAAARAPSSTMSVAGLKKQFHKATQVRRGQVRGGAVPGGAARGALGAARGPGARDPALPRCARIARPARRRIWDWEPALHSPPPAQCGARGPP